MKPSTPHDAQPQFQESGSSLCQEFEQRVNQTVSPKGAKTELIENAIAATIRPFTITDLEHACPGVSRDMIRQVLRKLKDANEIESLGRGPGAKWQRKGNTSKRG